MRAHEIRAWEKQAIDKIVDMLILRCGEARRAGEHGLSREFEDEARRACNLRERLLRSHRRQRCGRP